MRHEVRALLVKTVRHEGFVPRHTADALNLLNKGDVVETYKTFGNRWTIHEANQGCMELARASMGIDVTGAMGEWLDSLATTLEEPALHQPWYSSKVVRAVVSFAVLFVVVHAYLLWRALVRIHADDSMLLLLPLLGLAAASVVALLAICLNQLIERLTRDPPKQD